VKFAPSSIPEIRYAGSQLFLIPAIGFARHKQSVAARALPARGFISHPVRESSSISEKLERPDRAGIL
jgi:hypothetical protein